VCPDSGLFQAQVQESPRRYEVPVAPLTLAAEALVAALQPPADFLAQASQAAPQMVHPECPDLSDLAYWAVPEECFGRMIAPPDECRS